MINFKDLLEKNLVIENTTYISTYLEYVLNTNNCSQIEIYEKHHILPKSIFPEFASNKENIVLLSPSQHYYAHKYLALIGKNKELWYSYNMMKNTREYNRLINDEEYDNFKKELYKLHSEFVKQNNNFTREFNIRSNKIRWSDEKQKEKQSEFMKNNNPMSDSINRKKVSESKKGIPRPDISGENNPMKNPEIASLFKGENNPNYIGYIENSLGEKFYSKKEFSDFLKSYLPNESGYFYGKMINFIKGKSVVIKPREVEIFEKIKTEFTFFKK